MINRNKQKLNQILKDKEIIFVRQANETDAHIIFSEAKNLINENNNVVIAVFHNKITNNQETDKKMSNNEITTLLKNMYTMMIEMKSEITNINYEIVVINKRLDALEQDVANIKSEIVVINKRLDKIEDEIVVINKRLDTLEQDVKAIKECPTIKKELNKK